MYWKIKSAIQNLVSLFPDEISYDTYYWVQRHFGSLRKINPTKGLVAGIETWKRILKYGYDPSNKMFFEVGTGRIPLVPLSYWLMGAKRTITIDLNPYLKEELVREAIDYLQENRTRIKELFEGLINEDRLNLLLDLTKDRNFSIQDFLELCQIQYFAPGDAASTGLSPESIDFHTSYTVFEHIPPNILKAILIEGNRIIRNGGLFIHRIDYSDHFSHSDKTISAINFLQYSDKKWKLYAGNRYMYMNRLRHDDFIALFKSVGHIIVADEVDINESLLELLKERKIKLNDQFNMKSKNVLSITASWIISKKG